MYFMFMQMSILLYKVLNKLYFEKIRYLTELEKTFISLLSSFLMNFVGDLKILMRLKLNILWIPGKWKVCQSH